MKRLIVFIFMVALLCCVNFGFTQGLTLEKIFPHSSVEVYTDTKTDLQLNKIDNGAGEIIFCNIDDLNYILKTTQAVGFCIKVYKQNAEQVLKLLQPQNVLNQNYGYFGWSNVLQNINIKSKSVAMQQGKVNFQCVQNGEQLLIGVPIILGSY